jgi:hypothetical protein
MKMQFRITYCLINTTAAAALLFATGCGKTEQPSGETAKTTSPAANETPKGAAESAATAAVQKTVEAAQAAGQQVQTAAVAAAEQALSAATNQAAATVAESMSQVQTLIDKAKGLVTDQKYKDALTVVQQLSSMKLTPEQRVLVDNLKAQIQTALATASGTNAASALGNILGGKK